jgi:endonuclease/exonuclease/phosphatase (EEP) superfamily protein YafD
MFEINRKYLPNTILISIMVLMVLATVAHAKRFVLPDDADVVNQINLPTEGRLNPASINILVWNMYKGARSDWARDYKALSGNKDILFLQEVLLDKKMRKIFNEDTVNSYLVATSFRDSWQENTATGVATASDIQPVSSFYLRSHYREPIINTPKMGMFVEYQLAGSDKTLLTANIHAINFVSTEKHKNMLDEIEVALADHNGPVILAGDFNTWSDKKTLSLFEMTERLGLAEVEFKDDTRTRFMGNVLDWIFVRDLNVKGAHVHRDVNSSDHRALAAELSLIK